MIEKRRTNLTAAWKAAIRENPLLEIVLIDLLRHSIDLERKLKAIDTALNAA